MGSNHVFDFIVIFQVFSTGVHMVRLTKYVNH